MLRKLNLFLKVARHQGSDYYPQIPSSISVTAMSVCYTLRITYGPGVDRLLLVRCPSSMSSCRWRQFLTFTVEICSPQALPSFSFLRSRKQRGGKDSLSPQPRVTHTFFRRDWGVPFSEGMDNSHPAPESIFLNASGVPGQSLMFIFLRSENLST